MVQEQKQDMKPTVAVFGMGYVGLVSALAWVQEDKFNVIGVDTDVDKICNLQRGIIPFNEPLIEPILVNHLTNQSKKIQFTTSSEYAIENSQLAVICVGTPLDSTGFLNIDSVKACFDTIVNTCLPNYPVVVRSTVPVGTTRSLSSVYSKLKNIEVVYVPEFLKEGTAWEDVTTFSKAIIGVNGQLPQVVRELLLHGSYITTESLISFESAELAKLGYNAMLASRLSFINEIAIIADKTGANILDVARSISHRSDSSWPNNHLIAGIGWGGSCLPKDTTHLYNTLIKVAPNRANSSMLKCSIDVNDLQVEHVIDVVKGRFGSLNNLCFCVWGIAFKGNVDDTRNSQAQKIITRMADEGAIIKAFDPNGCVVEPHINVTQYHNINEATSNCEALLILTNDSIFHSAANNITAFDTKVVFDFVNLKESARWDKSIEHYAIGQPNKTL